MGRLLCVACRVGIFYAFFNPVRKLQPRKRQRSPTGKVRRSCANAHGTASKTALRRSLCKSHRSSSSEGARSSVTLLARIACEARASATARGGIPKGAQPSLASLCLLSAGQKVGARRGLSASKEKVKNFKNVKRVKKPSAKKSVPAACEVPRRGKRVEGESKKFQKRKEGKKALQRRCAFKTSGKVGFKKYIQNSTRFP